MLKSDRIAKHLMSRLPLKQEGKLGYVLAWALGVPIPILLIVFLVRGCS
jgi:hypothetical protein